MTTVEFPAKRGDIVLVPYISSATAMWGATVRATSYSLGMVTSVTRDGLVKSFAHYADGAPRYWSGLDRKPTSGSVAGAAVASASRFVKPVSEILESLPSHFDTSEEARDALRPFLA